MYGHFAIVAACRQGKMTMTVDRLLFTAALSILSLTTTSGGVSACDPVPIILKNVQSIPLNDQTRIALLLSITKDQYDEANKKLDGNLSYAPAYGIGYSDSRSTAELEAKASKFSFDRQFY